MIFEKIERSRNRDINLGHAISDEISSNPSTQKYDKANSKVETYVDGSEGISIDSLNQSDK